ncbi:MAG TPA: isoprenylcysteine carboxyl methyltransferase [Clostridiales bacterium]|nr:isoprenylcysteine carboxyl methyltransferase [Clostridiales bacterium]
MNIGAPNSRSDEKCDITSRVSWGRLLMAAIIMLVLPAVILFGSSGRLNWGMAWVYIGMTTAFTIGSRIIMFRKNPALIAERAQFLDKRDAKPWDKTLMPLVAIIGPTVMLIVAGLDERFGWSPNLPLALQVAALVITALGYLLGVWAIVVNKFFSAVVRIQRERGHTVVTSGPYRYVRHPGYAGGIVANFAMPLMLDSLWALVPAVLVNCLLIVRTALEDRTLQEELEGYRDYAGRVLYRLLPGVW